MKVKEHPVTEHTTLPLTAAVRLIDRTGTEVQRESLEEALALIRKRQRTESSVIALSDQHRQDQRFTHSYWIVTPEAVTAAETPGAADYTLRYTKYLITDSQGVTRGIQLNQIDSIAQHLADQDQKPVEIASALLGLESWVIAPQTPTAQPSHDQEPEPMPQPSETHPSDTQSEHHQLTEPSTNGHLPSASSPAEAESSEAAETASPASFAEAFATRKATRKSIQGPAEEGWRGGLNRALLMKLGPGPHERKLRSLRATVQQGLAGSKTVMFCNVKGGSKKTTTTFNTSAMIGRVRGGNILAWDNNENSGDLVDRGHRAPHGRTAIDLYERLDQLTTLENVDQLTHYMHPQGDNRFEVLASQNVAGTRQVIDATAFRDMHSILRTFYSMILVDTGNASTATTWQATAEAADVVVITMENAENSARKAAQTLDAIRNHAGDAKVANAVAVITQPEKSSGVAKERTAELHRLLEPQLRSVLEIPFDHALKEGEAIVWESLTRQTREAYLHVAAAVVEGM